MIKANELRIGNLVNSKTKDVVKIDEVFLFEASTYMIGYDSKFQDFATNFEPIPLIEEWLLRFGFVSNSISIYGIDKTLNVSAVVDGNYYLYLDDVFGSFYDLNSIQYVHQLQNLYFALTGEELNKNGNEH